MARIAFSFVLVFTLANFGFSQELGPRYGGESEVKSPAPLSPANPSAGENKAVRPGDPPVRYIPDLPAAKQPAPPAKSEAPAFTPPPKDVPPLKSPSNPLPPAKSAETAPNPTFGTPKTAAVKSQTAAERLLARANVLPQDGKLEGRPIALSEVLAAGSSAVRREEPTYGGATNARAAIEAYWRLSRAVAAYHFALDERNRMELVAGGLDQTLAPVRLALASVRAEVEEARAVAIAAQYRLAEFRYGSAETALPLPIDIPLASAYRTHYDAIFAARNYVLPEQQAAKRIDASLPVRLEAIRARAESAQAAADVADAVEQTARQRGTLSTMPAAIERLRSERRAFLADVLAYNLDIAHYATMVAPAGADGSTLLPMLIRVSPRPTNETQGATSAAGQPSGGPHTASQLGGQWVPQGTLESIGNAAPFNPADPANSAFQPRNEFPRDGVVPANGFEQPGAGFIAPAIGEENPPSLDANRPLRSVVVPPRER